MSVAPPASSSDGDPPSAAAPTEGGPPPSLAAPAALAAPPALALSDPSTARCVSRDSTIGTTDSFRRRSRRRAVRYVLLIDRGGEGGGGEGGPHQPPGGGADANAETDVHGDVSSPDPGMVIRRHRPKAALVPCACPRCCGLLSLRPVAEDEDEEYFEDAYYSDEEFALSDLPGPVPPVRGITEEESYLLKNTTKADRRAGTAGGGSGRARAVNKSAKKRAEADRKKMEQPKAKRAVRKREVRAEERAAQLAARKEHVGRRKPRRKWGGRVAIGIRRDPNEYWERRLNPPSPYPDGEMQVLSAEELGVEPGPMYERLLRILEGDDITPEDFDLLLSLDANNARNTLEVSEVSEFGVLTAGALFAAVEDEKEKENGGAEDGKQNGGDTSVPRKELGSGMCLICLEPFDDMEDGAELRRLPCDHVYCRGCIDRWLTETSAKCPELGCFWTTDEGDGDDGDGDEPRGAGGEETGGETQPPPAIVEPSVPPVDDNAEAAAASAAGFVVDADAIRRISDRLWSLPDLEAFLAIPHAEGGLSVGTVLELLVDLTPEVGHAPTIEGVQELWDDEVEEEEGGDEADGRAECVLELYQAFHSHVQGLLQRESE